MFTWLRARPVGARRPARAANPALAPIVPAFLAEEIEPLVPVEPTGVDADAIAADATLETGEALTAEVETMAAVEDSAPPPVDDELPPPFFADPDPAFLDLSDTPPPLPVSPPEPRSVMPEGAEDRLAQALANLPAYPAPDDPDRLQTLLNIYRVLDRIAGDVCNDLSAAKCEDEQLPEPVAAR
jgi:hypothetical protein